MVDRAEVEAALEPIRRMLELEGGSVELAAVVHDIVCVRVRLPGLSDGAAVQSLLVAIRRTLQASVPRVRAVVDQDLVDAGYPLEQLATRMAHLSGR